MALDMNEALVRAKEILEAAEGQFASDQERIVKELLVLSGISQVEMSKRIKNTHGNPMGKQNFNNKLASGAFTLNELRQMAIEAGCEFHYGFTLPNGVKIEC